MKPNRMFLFIRKVKVKKPYRMFLFATFLFLLALLVGSVTVWAISSKKVKIPFQKAEEEKTVFIYDKDNIINDKTERKLNLMLIELKEETRVEFDVISVKSFLDTNIETYSNIVFNELDTGKSEGDNRVLLLFSRSDKKARIEIGSGLESYLSNSKCDQILNNYFVPYSEKDNYSKATKMTVKAVLNVLAKEYNISTKDLEDVSVHNDYFVMIVVAAISLYILIGVFSFLESKYS